MRMNNKVASLWLLVIASLGSGVVSAQENVDTEPSFSDLFRAAAVRSVELSPTADYLVYQEGQQVFAGNGELGYVQIFDFSEDERIRDIEWIGDNTLVLSTYNRASGQSRLYSSKLGLDENGDFAELAWERHPVRGRIHDVLLDDPDRIVFARYRYEDDVVAVDLFRVNVFDKSNRLFRGRNKISTGSDEFIDYVQDAAGNYVIGLLERDGVPEIWQRKPGSKEWSRRWVANKESEIHPVSVSPDGRTLYALSNATTDKLAAVEFDLESGTLARVTYEHERFDLNRILVNEDHPVPHGVVYSEQGLLRYHFFADEHREEFVELQERFPDKGIVIVGRSNDDNVLLVNVSTSKDRGRIYRCDKLDDACEAILELSPWLEGKTLSDTIVLQVEAEEGLLVDAFLTMPAAGGESIPLVVMPHGGPIGVRDSRYFSGDVQWLAHNGYAVLQVNYRGSSGYGREFKEAGFREVGRGIEDDIESAVLLALERNGQLDRDRIGIFGGSYGGYSALMSTIRNPELYQCAASFAGVTDLTLLFARSRVHKNPALREWFTRIVGDPDLDYEEQTAHSPVYRYRDIKRPVFLAHGTRDRIVDIEHSWRLRMLLRLRGADPEFVVIDDVGHSFNYVEEAELLYGPLVGFLDKHLKP